MNDSISFKSKIKFVHNIDFLKNYSRGTNIGYTHCEPNVLKSDVFYTKSIRTCTGGGLVTPQKGCLGFHIWDDMVNKKNFEKIAHSIIRWLNPAERGLLIGAKALKGSDYSIEQFKRFKEFLSKHVPNLSIFEKHQHECSQSHISYSLKDDTWFIASDFLDNVTGEYYQVNNLETLRKAFENIKIAKGDELYIGEMKINPKDAPDLFS